MNILIFVPNHIGDAVMSTPMILTLKENYPCSKIYVFALKKVMDIYKPFPAIDFLFEYDKSIINTLAKIKGIDFDYSFCLASSFKVALISKIKKVPNIIGYGRNWRSPLLTHKIRYYRDKPEYIANFYLKLLRFVKIKKWITKPQVFVEDITEKSITSKIENYGIKIGKDKIACILPAYTGYLIQNAKAWKEEYFAKVGEYLVNNGFSTFIIIGPKEERLAEHIKSFNNDLIPLINPVLSIQEVKAFLKYIDIFISVDSGLRFIARAFNKKGVTIYGPISPFWSLPTDLEGEIPLYLNLSCSPCDLINCPIPKHPCTNLITPQMVIDKIKRLVE